jgi:hypothetical protein
MKHSICFLLFFVSSYTNAQDSTEYKRVKVLPLPAFGYAPETSGSIGAVCLFSFNMYNDSNTRLSNAKIEFNYTLNKQIIIENVWSYFFKDEKWFTDGIIHYSIYPDFYYGIGANTPLTNKVLFSSNRFVFQGNVFKKIGDQLFAGVNLKYIDYSKLRNQDSLQYSELATNGAIGFGFSVLKDTRNNILTPLDGWFLKASSGYNFSKTNYFEASLDGRYYKTWKSRFTFAGRFLNKMTAGTPAFFDYSSIGGDNIVRGYRYGRYRDKNLTTLQSEFRAHLFWRIGIAAFAGVSNLYPTIGKFDFRTIRPNAGLGLRILVDKKDNTSLRLDYAIGSNGNNGFYVSFGESF